MNLRDIRNEKDTSPKTNELHDILFERIAGSRPLLIARDRRELLPIRVIRVFKVKVKNTVVCWGGRDVGEGRRHWRVDFYKGLVFKWDMGSRGSLYYVL